MTRFVSTLLNATRGRVTFVREGISTDKQEEEAVLSRVM